jgi:CheY-like chemotaxis protein
VVGNVPIIAISASASGTDMQRAIEAGATAFLPKPFRLPALLALIEEHVGVRYSYATKAQGLQRQAEVG